MQTLEQFPRFEAFRYSTAVAFEPGISRRDPSPVVELDSSFYVWYSKSTADPSGYAASVWYATSEDGVRWTERGEALPKGPSGSWDEHGVFTPSILIAGEAYYLFYTAVGDPFDNDNGGPGGNKTAIGVAVAEIPEGPWQRCGDMPVLTTTASAEVFDSHRVDDSCLLVRDGTYWLYYKGRQLGLSPAETKMGVAMADEPSGPYVKLDSNPIISSGHEVCVWPHGAGIAAIMAPVGPQGSSLQYSHDGLHFDRVCSIEPPIAPGPFRVDRFTEGLGNGITWGISMAFDRGSGWPYLLRFDADLRSR